MSCPSVSSISSSFRKFHKDSTLNLHSSPAEISDQCKDLNESTRSRNINIDSACNGKSVNTNIINRLILITSSIYINVREDLKDRIRSNTVEKEKCQKAALPSFTFELNQAGKVETWPGDGDALHGESGRSPGATFACVVFLRVNQYMTAPLLALQHSANIAKKMVSSF